jgi:hypothetical protein
VRRERQGGGSATEKCDEFPSLHGVSRAEGHAGHVKNITFEIENAAVEHAQAARCSCPKLGQERRFERESVTSAVHPTPDMSPRCAN